MVETTLHYMFGGPFCGICLPLPTSSPGNPKNVCHLRWMPINIIWIPEIVKQFLFEDWAKQHFLHHSCPHKVLEFFRKQIEHRKVLKMGEYQLQRIESHSLSCCYSLSFESYPAETKKSVVSSFWLMTSSKTACVCLLRCTLVQWNISSWYDMYIC